MYRTSASENKLDLKTQKVCVCVCVFILSIFNMFKYHFIVAAAAAKHR